MKTTAEENKENPSVGNTQPISDLLMKPFALGWTREVVRRVVTHCGTPNCDIYYFSPNKKKLRSLTEVKSNLTDGLSIECFSFKREPLGLSPDLETVRDAKVRGKGIDKLKEKRKVPETLKRQTQDEHPEEEANDSGRKAKRKKTETMTEDSKTESKVTETTETVEKLNESERKSKKKKTEAVIEDSKPDSENIENEEKSHADHNSEEEEVKKGSREETVTKPRRTKSEGKDSKDTKSFINKSRTKSKRSPSKPSKPVRLQSVKIKKSALKRVRSAKQAKQTAGRKTLKGVVKKKKDDSTNRKSSKTKSQKKSGLKTKKNSSVKIKKGKRPVKSSLPKAKNEVAKAPETNDADKKSAARDLKSIVKKNIGKYREMREKQKLGAVKNQGRNPSRKLAIAHIPRSRSEPISKNKPFYLKPLEKGWRRELVYRTNCAKAGQQADVYYFHPNGKKLRSCREIAENLTHGLSIDCFTFRKEPIGCGEPSEVIRNARSLQKKNSNENVKLCCPS